MDRDSFLSAADGVATRRRRVVGRGHKSALRRLMEESFAELAPLLDSPDAAPDWRLLAERWSALGLRNTDGSPLSSSVAQITWLRVKRARVRPEHASPLSARGRSCSLVEAPPLPVGLTPDGFRDATKAAAREAFPRAKPKGF